MADRSELAAEQAHVDRAYERLAVRQGFAASIGEDAPTETPQDLLRRDRLAIARARRESQLKLGDLALCFGRIDTTVGESWHIGRIGVDDEDGEQLVVDWRAPVAEPFYRATSAEPLGLSRRRHLRCRASTVLELDDEIFAEDAGDDGETASDIVVVGEAALFRAINRQRTGRMADIVATIQQAQDEIIRAPLDLALIVQGGPGTGKTAVALHRIAYLLYTHRELLEAKGVLLVGPSSTFLRYIESVLPSLGEQGATLTTIGSLGRPGPPTREDTTDASKVKGDLRMAAVLKRALEYRQRPVAKRRVVGFGAYRLGLTPAAARQLVDRVKAVPGTHNERRPRFERQLLAHLHRVYERAVEKAQLAGHSPAPAMDRDAFIATARRQPGVVGLLDRMWPLLTPEQLVGDLLCHPPLLAEAAEGLLEPEEQRAICCAREDVERGWTEGDVALLDEVADAIGRLPERRTRPSHDEDLNFMADRVIDAIRADEDISLNATMVEEIRDRIVGEEVAIAEPLRARRVGSSFGHVVVDEAQDLSPMQWRMIARRCPTASVTVVGDLGQASGQWQLGWPAVLELLGSDRPSRVIELTVNYRTPSEVMELANHVRRAVAPDLGVPASVRSVGRQPEAIQVSAGELATAVARRSAALVEDAIGTVAVIAPVALHAALRDALDVVAVTKSVAIDPLDDPVALLTATRAKGLEFDAVIVVEPDRIVSEATGNGLLALYVALTRTTGELQLLHTGQLPSVLQSALTSDGLSAKT